MAISRKSFVEKHGRHAWDAREWVRSYSAIGNQSTNGTSKENVTSKSTQNQYKQLMKQVSEELVHFKTTLNQATPEQYEKVLERFSENINQKSLSNMRIAIEKGLHTKEKYQEIKLPMIKSEIKEVLNSRAYTPEALKVVHDQMSDKHRLSLELVAVTNIRAHELFTIRPLAEQAVSPRNYVALYPDRKDWIPYTVVGKGGLHTLKMLPPALAEKLEARRVPEHTVKDRGISYKSVYDLVGGNAMSKAFSRHSQQALGFSYGIHGCRHSYAQRRMDELKQLGLDRDMRLLTVSQEMGHFRPDITEVYLR